VWSVRTVRYNDHGRASCARMQHGEITDTRDDIAAGRVWTVPAVCLPTAAGSRSAPILQGSIRGRGIGAGERSCWYRYDKRTRLVHPRGVSVDDAPCHAAIGACARVSESRRSPVGAQHPARTSQRARDALTHQAPTRSIPRTSQHPSASSKSVADHSTGLWMERKHLPRLQFGYIHHFSVKPMEATFSCSGAI